LRKKNKKMTEKRGENDRRKERLLESYKKKKNTSQRLLSVISTLLVHSHCAVFCVCLFCGGFVGFVFSLAVSVADVIYLSLHVTFRGKWDNKMPNTNQTDCQSEAPNNVFSPQSFHWRFLVGVLPISGSSNGCSDRKICSLPPLAISHK
jgi:hypothetical protein